MQLSQQDRALAAQFAGPIDFEVEVEARAIKADHEYNRLKNSGELERRHLARAIADDDRHARAAGVGL